MARPGCHVDAATSCWLAQPEVSHHIGCSLRAAECCPSGVPSWWHVAPPTWCLASNVGWEEDYKGSEEGAKESVFGPCK